MCIFAVFGVHSHAEFETKTPLNGNDAGCASLALVYISAVPEYHSISSRFKDATTRVKFAPPGIIARGPRW